MRTSTLSFDLNVEEHSSSRETLMLVKDHILSLIVDDIIFSRHDSILRVIDSNENENVRLV